MTIYMPKVPNAKRLHLACLTAAAVALTACSQPAPAPTRSIAEVEFIQTCALIANFEQTQASAKASGWEGVRTDSHPALKAVVIEALTEESQVVGGFKSMEGNWGKETYVYRTNPNTNRLAYRKTIDGRDFYLILLTSKLGFGASQYGCFMYDFQDGYALDIADRSRMIEEWLQSPPTGFNDVPDVTHARLWSGKSLPQPLNIMGVGAVNINDTRKIRKNIGYYGRHWFVLSNVLTPKLVAQGE